MANVKQIARQEIILAEAQKRLERIEKMREQMIAQVEKEMEFLEKLRETPEDFTKSVDVTPNTGASTPESFQSQYDQFGGTRSNERLSTIGNEGIDIAGIAKKLTGLGGNNSGQYNHSAKAKYWTELIEDPGVPIYASGVYVSSEHGNHSINSIQEYEYKVSTRALPLSVGDVVRVPVHPTGHGDGKAFSTGHLQYMVTALYDTPRFHQYHDLIE